MSIVIDATYKGETFEVEIFHDGAIEFPGHDLQYEQAEAEFTRSKSAAVQLYDLWKEKPTDVIFENLELPENSNLSLAADYAEHVLYIFENERRGDLRPRKAIEAIRKFIVGEIDRKAAKKAESAAWASAAAAWASAAAARAASAAAWAASAASVKAASAADASWAASQAEKAAAKAAAHNVSADEDSEEWQQAYDAEVAWQVRRFVDCMEAVGQDLPWPNLKATK